MDKLILQDKEQRALEIHHLVLLQIKKISRDWVVLVQLLQKVKDEKLYELEALGGFVSFEQYLESPEVSQSRKTIQNYFRLLDVLNTKGVDIKECEDIGINKTQLLITTKDPEKWIAQAKELTYEGLRRNILEKEKGFTNSEVEDFLKQHKSSCPHWKFVVGKWVCTKK